ncbi:polymerase [Cryomyces antarcticus]
MEKQEGLERKKALFDGLYSLGREDDDDNVVDEGLRESQALISAAKRRKGGTPPTNSHAHDGVRQSDGIARQARIIEVTPMIQAVIPDAHRTTRRNLLRDSISSDKLTQFPRASGKRRRDDAIQLAPEARQVFKDLAFYFFPNNDVHPARRMRITKALEYGALWIKEWVPGVTHVIVDRSMTYSHVTGFLKLASLPPDVIVVDECYPAECISFRTLLDPKQTQYQVCGYKEAVPEQRVPPSSTAPSSQTSLQLKPAGKDVMTREPQTPSRTEESGRDPPSAGGSSSLCSNPDRREETKAIKTAAPVYHGALNEVIEEARGFQNLPLDSDAEDESPEPSPAEPNSKSSDAGQKYQSKTKKSAGTPWQDDFHCMQAHDGVNKASNPNTRTIEVLEEMGRYYDQTADSWRSIAYRKAIASLRKQPHKITTQEEAARLPFPSDYALQTFLNIYGVGFSQASRWVSQGHKTLADLSANAHLTDNQKIGIAHYADFLARIPRTEVEQLGAVVQAALRNIDPSFRAIIMGSFRRGATDSGDIDLIITAPAAPIQRIRATVYEILIPALFAQGFLKVALATASKDTGSRWHGACALPNSSIWRRIDFLLVPDAELGAALIYFTGNDIFNRSIRLLASRKGMCLNQRGLYADVVRAKGREKIAQGRLVEGSSERAIFEALGVPWREPEMRIC